MIQPGDMVMLVLGCCHYFLSQFGIQGVYHGPCPDESCISTCRHCGNVTEEKCAIGRFDGMSRDFHLPYSWIRKLDPPAESGTITHTTEKREEVEA